MRGALAVFLVLASTAAPGSSRAAEGGTTLAWGSNARGQLGDGTTTSMLQPGVATGLTGVTKLAAGANHTLALMADGTVRAWGANDQGQLGNGSTEDSTTPQDVQGLADIVAIAAGYNHNLALRNDGTLFAWGDGRLGQLGNGYPPTHYEGAEEPDCDYFLGIIPTECKYPGLGGPPDHLSVPEVVQSARLKDVVGIAAGNGYSLAVLADGSVWGWGLNDRGQLGAGVEAFLNGPVLPAPVPVGWNTRSDDRLGGIVEVAAGGAHSVARAGDGSLFAWGSNSSGQLGNPERVSVDCVCRPGPAEVLGIGQATSVSAGDAHNLAIVGSSVYGWGDNRRGQVGDNTGIDRPLPIRLQDVPSGGGLGGSLPVQVAAGQFHSVVLLNNAPIEACGTPGDLCLGVLYAWGGGTAGQFGDNSTSDRGFPARIATLENVTAVAAGGEHTVTIDGTIGLRLIFPLEDISPVMTVAPYRPELPPVVVGPTSTPPPAPSAPKPSGPFVPFATATPTP